MTVSPFELVYRIVERIPRGKVATYGQISRMLDSRISAQFVGWALHSVPAGRKAIPWHRVVNARGGISTRQVLGYAPDLQKLLLQEEGVAFDANDRLDLATHLWKGLTDRQLAQLETPRPQKNAKTAGRRSTKPS